MPETPARELSSINFEAMLGGPLMAVVNAQAKAAMSSVNFIKSVGFKAGASADPEQADTGEPIYVAFKYPKEVKPYAPEVPASFTIQVSNGGSGYTSAPTVAISGGGGSGASATAIVTSGAVTEVRIDAAGSGWTAAPSISFTGGGGSGATATATFVATRAAAPAEFATMKLEVPILTMLPIPFIRIEETTIDFNAKINSVEEARADSSTKVDASLDATVKYPPKFSIATVNLKVSASHQKNTSSGYKVDRTYSMAVHIRAVQDEMPAGMEKILGILEDSIRSQPAEAKK
ncbi:MAG TPA: DUF2589 domain-containing protein [Anaeromyxobacter sp.]|nr:DUF2589 domain-containing protein [Anaeromyxobacter sp.]